MPKKQRVKNEEDVKKVEKKISEGDLSFTGKKVKFKIGRISTAVVMED